MNTHILNCEICGHSCAGLGRYRQHQNRHRFEPDQKAKIPCYICGKEVVTGSMPSHISAQHPASSGGPQLKCDLCDYTTYNKFYMGSHKKRHQNKMVKCPVCDRMVKYLESHVRRGNCFTKKEATPCDLCNKTFTSVSHLKRHVRQIHMQIKDKLCDICDYRTYTSFNLKIHKAKMHTKESLEVFCDICNQKTMNLDHHKKLQHFEEYVSEKQARQAELDGLKEDTKLELVREPL